MINARLLEVVGHAQRLRVLHELKRTPGGLAVTDLAARMGLSYMGAKEICQLLEKRGLLATWRDPQPNGRPRLLYRLCEKTHVLFPDTGPALSLDLLQAAHRLYGAAAPEKLLRLAVQERAQALQTRVGEGTVLERAEALVRARNAEGCLGTLEHRSAEESAIVEYHSPWLAILRAYPLLARLEAELFHRVLGVSVTREETSVLGHYQVTFTFGHRIGSLPAP